MTKHILLTGSTGILGIKMNKLLESANIKVTKFRGNLCSESDIIKNVSNSKFDTVIHLAAMVPVQAVEANPAQAYAVNVGGTINLLNALISEGQHCRFFYASSSHVYEPKETPILETDPAAPSTLYGRTKLEGERIAQDICAQAKLPFCSGRIFSFYDKNQKVPFLYPSIIKRLESEDLSLPFQLFGAESIRDMSSAEQITELIFKLINTKAQGIYNIGSGNGISIRDFVSSLTTTKLKIESKGSSNNLVANIEKLHNHLRNEA